MSDARHEQEYLVLVGHRTQTAPQIGRSSGYAIERLPLYDAGCGPAVCGWHSYFEPTCGHLPRPRPGNGVRFPGGGPGFLRLRGRTRRTQPRLKPSAHLSHSLPSNPRAPLCMRPGDLSCSSSLCPRPMADAVRLLNPLADLWCSGSSRHSGCRGRSILVLCLRATGRMTTSMSMIMTMTMTTMAVTRSMTGLCGTSSHASCPGLGPTEERVSFSRMFHVAVR